jgi:alkane 1-monooxygenase
LQSVVGSVRSAWRLEAGRLGRRGKAVASPRNRIVVYVGLELAILVSIWILLGAGTAAFFVFQAVVAFSLLEIVNYVEHYGLRRRYDGRRYERVSVEHSWDSPRRLTNYFLINLQRHPDHHMGPQHRYQLLSHTQESPRLPGGYAGMALLALVPPLWYRAIDPILERYDGRHESERA